MEFLVHEFLKRLHRLHPAKSCEILVNPATTHWCETAISFRPALPLPVWARGHHLSQTLVSPRLGFRRLTAETRLSPDDLANYCFCAHSMQTQQSLSGFRRLRRPWAKTLSNSWRRHQRLAASKCDYCGPTNLDPTVLWSIPLFWCCL